MPTPKIYQVANLQTQLTSTSDSANNRVLKAGDTMTGNLNVANVVSGTALTLSTGASSNGNIIFSANGVEDMRITPAGDVGIGTTNPGYRLDVQNPAATTWARIGNSAINSGAGIIFNGASTQKNWIIASQYNVNGGLEFTQTTTGGGSTISSTPTLQLNPNGTISSYAASGTGAQFSVFSNGQTTVPVTLAQGFATATDNIGYLYNRANADFVFGTNNTERMRLTNAGKLVSTGGAVFYGTVSSSGNGSIMEQGSNTNGRYIRFADGTQICWVIDKNFTIGSVSQIDGGWTYPAAFVDGNIWAYGYVRAGASEGSSIVTATPSIYGINGSNIDMYLMRLNGARLGTSGTVNLVLYAIGRWY